MTRHPPRLTLGTRGSPLALAQTALVADGLRAAHPDLAEGDAVRVMPIRTSGDLHQDQALADIGGKGLFTRELDIALAEGRIDAAVHSMKDVPTVLPPGISIAAVLPRADVRDAFIGRAVRRLDDLPAGSLVGTASLRRQAQVLHRRPDLRVGILRGNVQTRLRKLADREVDATLLAVAGLDRLGRRDIAGSILDPEEVLPAVAQGAIGIACRIDDRATRDKVLALDDLAAHAEIICERAFLAVLDGSCRTPIAGLARVAADGRLAFRGCVFTADGAARWEASGTGPIGDAIEIGANAGRMILAQTGRPVVDIVPAGAPPS